MKSSASPARRFDKRLRLLAWALVHRVPPEREVTNVDLAKAAKWFGGIAPEGDPALRTRWAEWIRNVLDRRARRRGWLERHGSVPDGWTPPRGWEWREDVRVRAKGPKPSKRERAGWRFMLDPSRCALAAQKPRNLAAAKALWEADCTANRRDPRTGKRIKTV